MIHSARLFYKNHVKDIGYYGFETNQYDPFVANKTVNGFQMKVFWNMDDLKVSHECEFYITRFLYTCETSMEASKPVAVRFTTTLE